MITLGRLHPLARRSSPSPAYGRGAIIPLCQACLLPTHGAPSLIQIRRNTTPEPMPAACREPIPRRRDMADRPLNYIGNLFGTSPCTGLSRDSLSNVFQIEPLWAIAFPESPAILVRALEGVPHVDFDFRGPADISGSPIPISY
jgi:hypothetical protein